jgi:hypothetical protein
MPSREDLVGVIEGSVFWKEMKEKRKKTGLNKESTKRGRIEGRKRRKSRLKIRENCL